MAIFFPYCRFAKAAITRKKGQKWTFLELNLKVKNNKKKTTLDFRDQKLARF